eukprot:GILK01013532.1.p1 GENE.GILK01013532.1~~GILK01013532.1.p1  ORF type:complete len:130 (+),score=1.77 GILK01013532.1:166-555(+)
MRKSNRRNKVTPGGREWFFPNVSTLKVGVFWHRETNHGIVDVLVHTNNRRAHSLRRTRLGVSCVFTNVSGSLKNVSCMMYVGVVCVSLSVASIKAFRTCVVRTFTFTSTVLSAIFKIHRIENELPMHSR